MATRLAKNAKLPVNGKEVNCFEVEEVTTRTLSAKDSHALLEILDSDIEPNSTTRNAVARYRDLATECPPVKGKV